MPPKRHAVKGEPDFHTVSDEKLKSFLDLTQSLIFSYENVDEGKVKVLEEIWKDLSCENTDRLANSSVAEQEVSSGTPAHLLKKVPKIRKSPVKRNI